MRRIGGGSEGQERVSGRHYVTKKGRRVITW